MYASDNSFIRPYRSLNEVTPLSKRTKGATYVARGTVHVRSHYRSTVARVWPAYGVHQFLADALPIRGLKCLLPAPHSSCREILLYQRRPGVSRLAQSVVTTSMEGVFEIRTHSPLSDPNGKRQFGT